jgi:hypothetical protein
MTGPYDEDRELGFAGMLATGMTPLEAWQEIRAAFAVDPETRELVRALPAETLEWSAREWARYGLRPPWEDDEP